MTSEQQRRWGQQKDKQNLFGSEQGLVDGQMSSPSATYAHIAVCWVLKSDSTSHGTGSPEVVQKIIIFY